MSIRYTKGYRYQLAQDYKVPVPLRHLHNIQTKWFMLTTNGMLHINEGYAWDGPTGGIDTKDFMRGSLVHDVLYQMMGKKLLPLHWRKVCDQILQNICREDGMSWIRAQWVYRAVRLNGKVHPNPEGTREVRTAP